MTRRTRSLSAFEIEFLQQAQIQNQIDAIRKEFREDRKESEARLAADRAASEARLAADRRDFQIQFEADRKEARSTKRWLIGNFVAVIILLIVGFITLLFTIVN